MNRESKGVSTAIAAMASVALVAAGGLAGWWVHDAAHGATGFGSGADASLEVTVACDGWSEGNVGLGAFVSGCAPDGSSFDEQVAFDGPGSRELAVPAGAYQAAPQVPQLMLEDGSVAACGSSFCWCAPGGDAGTLTLVYEAVDMAPFTDEDLAEVAAGSFVDKPDATVLERARALRDAASASGPSTPDIDGETPGDVPGPVLIGGE